jgi:hypothetical protein
LYIKKANRSEKKGGDLRDHKPISTPISITRVNVDEVNLNPYHYQSYIHSSRARVHVCVYIYIYIKNRKLRNGKGFSISFSIKCVKEMM